jgi:UDPglucose 6-dehydrogenase
MGKKGCHVRIGVVGLGYVGLVTAAVLGSRGNSVKGIDVDISKIKMLNSGKFPIYEPELDDRIRSAGENLEFSGDFSKLTDCDVIFLCVPTPNMDDKIDLRYVLSAATEVKKYNASADLVIKSTVLPGTAKKVAELTGMNVVSNPEFTREGSAIHDTEKPDRIVIGGRSVQNVIKLWEFTCSPVVVTSNENAELIKYASNAFLAVKISYINQIADLCEKIPGTDVKVVAEGMGLDRRIGKEFLKAGLGYGGSCFPKDTIAMSSFAKENGVDLSIVDSAIRYNNDRVPYLVNKILENVGSLKGRKVCVLGLSFKDNTDDLRESRSVMLIDILKSQGAIVVAYDPVVRNFGSVDISDNMKDCISSSEIVITATEWGEFSQINPSIFKGKKVFDLRRILDPATVEIVMGVGIGKN